MKQRSLLLLMLACLVACGMNDRAGDLRELPVLRRQSGMDPNLNRPGVLLINARDEYARLGIATLDELNVNFDQESLVVAAVGEKRTGGYWVRIRQVQLINGKKLRVRATTGEPGPGQMVTQALTCPYEAVVIAKVKPEWVDGRIEASRASDMENR